MSTNDQNQGRDKEQPGMNSSGNRSEGQQGRGVSSENRGLGSQDNDLQQVVSGGAQQSSFAEETEEKDIDEDLQTERSRPKPRNTGSESRNTSSMSNDDNSAFGEEEGSPSGRKSGDLDIKKDRSI